MPPIGLSPFEVSEKYISYFQELREYEEHAFHIMLKD